MANRLAEETSPYLLQHAENPVDWYPWGPEALERAKAEDRPILLSIGYAACHWCHVMERESFEDETVAAYMNEHFVCIKVDREERPDIAWIYMDAFPPSTGPGAPTTGSTAASEPARSSHRRRSSSCSCGSRFRDPSPAGRRPGTWSSSRCAAWRTRASTTRWAVGSIATQRTGPGSSRTSRRCSTTTPSSPASTPTHTRPGTSPSTGGSPSRPSRTCCVTCAT